MIKEMSAPTYNS